MSIQDDALRRAVRWTKLPCDHDTNAPRGNCILAGATSGMGQGSIKLDGRPLLVQAQDSHRGGFQ